MVLIAERLAVTAALQAICCAWLCKERVRLRHWHVQASLQTLLAAQGQGMSGRPAHASGTHRGAAPAAADTLALMRLMQLSNQGAARRSHAAGGTGRAADAGRHDYSLALPPLPRRWEGPQLKPLLMCCEQQDRAHSKNDGSWDPGARIRNT